MTLSQTIKNENHFPPCIVKHTCLPVKPSDDIIKFSRFLRKLLTNIPTYTIFKTGQSIGILHTGKI